MTWEEILKNYYMGSCSKCGAFISKDGDYTSCPLKDPQCPMKVSAGEKQSTSLEQRAKEMNTKYPRMGSGKR